MAKSNCLDPHTTKMLRVQVVRGAVNCFHTPSLAWESLSPENESLNIQKKRLEKNALNSRQVPLFPSKRWTTMSWKMPNKNREMATNYSSLNLGQQGHASIFYVVKFSDRWHLLGPDLSEVCCRRNC